MARRMDEEVRFKGFIWHLAEGYVTLSANKICIISKLPGNAKGSYDLEIEGMSSGIPSEYVVMVGIASNRLFHYEPDLFRSGSLLVGMKGRFTVIVKVEEIL